MLLDERQSVLKGLEKVEAELAAAENDGPTSAGFAKVGLGSAHKGFINNVKRSEFDSFFWLLRKGDRRKNHVMAQS